MMYCKVNKRKKKFALQIELHMVIDALGYG